MEWLQRFDSSAEISIDETRQMEDISVLYVLFALGFGLLVWAAVASSLMAPVDETLRRSLFTWWPASLNLSAFVQQIDLYSLPVLCAVVLGSLALNIIIPTVEELYFRGYLLPRMANRGWLAPLSSLLLFRYIISGFPGKTPAGWLPCCR